MSDEWDATIEIGLTAFDWGYVEGCIITVSQNQIDKVKAEEILAKIRAQYPWMRPDRYREES